MDKDYLPENLQKKLPSIEELITIVKRNVILMFLSAKIKC